MLGKQSSFLLKWLLMSATVWSVLVSLSSSICKGNPSCSSLLQCTCQGLWSRHYFHFYFLHELPDFCCRAWVITSWIVGKVIAPKYFAKDTPSQSFFLHKNIDRSEVMLEFHPHRGRADAVCKVDGHENHTQRIGANDFRTLDKSMRAVQEKTVCYDYNDPIISHKLLFLLLCLHPLIRTISSSL